jgi:methyl-accepting chemotaxis protein
MLKKLPSNIRISTQLNIALVVLIASLSTTVFAVFTSTTDKDAKVINETGVVRGGTQRAIKLELSGKPDDQLISKLDKLIEGLINGSEELGLPKVKDSAYLANMDKLKTSWGEVKQLSQQLRQNPQSTQTRQQLLKASEELFTIADETVGSSENYVANQTQSLKEKEIFFFALEVIILVAIFFIVRNITGTLNKFTDNIASSSEQIASNVDVQQKTVTSQASSVSQTTTTMDQLGSTSLQSAITAESSNSGALQALTLAEEGSESVQEAIAGISTLKEQVNAIAEQIMRLSEQTGQIVNISQLVGDIANQTNMLALNAAVEAVRAGEQGKGFTVVAGEIRKLADESKKSAEKISAVANSIQASMNATVMVTDEGTKKATESISLAEGLASAFAGVKQALNQVAMNSQQISQGSKEQAVSVQEVISAMNEVNLGAQETATGIMQVKQVVEQLKEEANRLKAIV